LPLKNDYSILWFELCSIRCLIFSVPNGVQDLMSFIDHLECFLSAHKHGGTKVQWEFYWTDGATIVFLSSRFPTSQHSLFHSGFECSMPETFEGLYSTTS